MAPRSDKDPVGRRALIRGAAAAAVGGLTAAVVGCDTSQKGPPAGSLRPPGALPEAEFLAKCIRCGRCATVCESGCIRFANSLEEQGSTPYIVPSERACVLCMRCTHVCPSGALVRIEKDRTAIAEQVRMGVAELHGGLCWARGGRGVCRACWYACPYADEAIVLRGPFLRPVVVEDRCVGCGLCVAACPPDAEAMIVRPT